MDLTWKRAWQRIADYNGETIRSYGEVEELQIGSWLKALKKSKACYAIEQAASVRNFLKRNPDREEDFKKLVREGRLELLGGGEAVIDYNMVGGESIVRNHLYPLLWYRREFGKKLVNACCTDTFGLSGQLPQIFRKLGYESISMYTRIFQDSKPFWQGLDGTPVLLADPMRFLKFITHTEAFGFSVCKPAHCCKGAGCPACGGTGMDFSFRDEFNPRYFAPLFQRLVAEDDKRGYWYQSEEHVIDPSRMAALPGLAAEYGLDLQFITFGGLVEREAKKELSLLRNGSIPADLIDASPEGNPVCTGCYVTRIRLKQLNRELEEILRSAETFDALLSPDKCTRKLELLWRKMSFFQFHDALTSSHTDFCHEELLQCAKEIRFSGMQILNEAMSALAETVQFDSAESDAFPVLVANPLSWPVKHEIVKIPVALPEQYADCRAFTVWNQKREVSVLAVAVHPLQQGVMAELTCQLPELPPLGYSSVYVKPELSPVPECNPQEITSGNTIENEFLKISFDKRGAAEVSDRKTGGKLWNRIGRLRLENDIGSPWETLAQPVLEKWLDEIGPVTVRLEKHPWGMTAELNGRLENLSHNWNYDPQGFKTCIWRETITLRRGVPAIDLELEVDWEAENGRLQVAFEPAFQMTEDGTCFDIPFGAIKRKPYPPVFGYHTKPNGDWPAYNGICQESSDGRRSVSVLTRGLPAFQVKENTIFSSPLRSPTVPLYAFDIGGARDTGKHVFQYRLTSHAGGFAQSELAKEGMAFNACYPVKQVIARNAEGKRPPEDSFGSLDSPTAVISAVKQAESGKGLVVRACETSGTACLGKLHIAGYEVKQVLNLLEEPMPGDPGRYEKFEIKTLGLAPQP